MLCEMPRDVSSGPWALARGLLGRKYNLQNKRLYYTLVVRATCLLQNEAIFVHFTAERTIENRAFLLLSL